VPENTLYVCVKYYGQLYIEQFVYAKLDYQFAPSVVCYRVTEKIYKYAFLMLWVNAKHFGLAN